MTRQKQLKAWTPGMQELIAQFLAVGPSAEPFDLRPGARVIDHAKFRSALISEIELGAGGPRAKLGSLESDLRDYLANRKV